jgi:hypothetical protein
MDGFPAVAVSSYNHGVANPSTTKGRPKINYLEVLHRKNIRKAYSGVELLLFLMPEGLGSI